ncbi:MAG TPA: GspE/PulE family protein [Candidatus Paceibacterota bacterium]
MKFELKIKQELEQGTNLSIINLVGYLIEYAQSVFASDIHMDPTGDRMRVRFRVDGILRDVSSLPKAICSEVISRIKVLAGLRTDEHSAAQDGRFRITFKDSTPIDVRVSITPAYYGENAVLRLLSQGEENFDLEKLGLRKEDREKILSAIRRPHGMILSTGPTGSGKTTTLYTLIKLLNTSEVSIVTIEDPIEYAIADIRQIQVNHRSGLTFANGLRSILRQDPNIIMVGEIRDEETAGIAVNTALTGHLLLSTLHTSDASTTLPRLLDMKIDSYLVASTVNVAMGQRLARKICTACKSQKKLSDAERRSLTELTVSKILDNQMDFYYGAGCEKCGGSGYRGRVGIYEILMVESNVRDAILRKASAAEIKDIAMRNGMKPMIEDGLEKVKLGETTFEEVLRLIRE